MTGRLPVDLRPDGDWQGRIAASLAAAARPLAVDPRLGPRRADGAEDPDPSRWDRSRFPPARQAATLLLIYPVGDELFIPLTVRHDALPDHPGEVSLPGGAVDPGDESVEATALREAHEEIGLDQGAARVVGRLDPVWIPVSNFELTPVVAVADHRPDISPRPDEVAEIVEFPLALLLDEAGLGEEEIIVPGAVLMAGAYRWGGHRVWGATARTLSMLAVALAATPPLRP